MRPCTSQPGITLMLHNQVVPPYTPRDPADALKRLHYMVPDHTHMDCYTLTMRPCPSLRLLGSWRCRRYTPSASLEARSASLILSTKPSSPGLSGQKTAGSPQPSWSAARALVPPMHATGCARAASSPATCSHAFSADGAATAMTAHARASASAAALTAVTASVLYVSRRVTWKPRASRPRWSVCWARWEAG